MISIATCPEYKAAAYDDIYEAMRPPTDDEIAAEAAALASVIWEDLGYMLAEGYTDEAIIDILRL